MPMLNRRQVGEICAGLAAALVLFMAVRSAMLLWDYRNVAPFWDMVDVIRFFDRVPNPTFIDFFHFTANEHQRVISLYLSMLDYRLGAYGTVLFPAIFTLNALLAVVVTGWC